MKLAHKIRILTQLGQCLQEEPSPILADINKANRENQWFTKENIQQSIQSICQQMLSETALKEWVAAYNIPEEQPAPKTVGLVMAGNIPLVGFHDFLCVFLSGHIAQVKLSSKDDALFKAIALQLHAIEPEITQYIQIQPQLKNFDAIIATGSDNTARYFHHYFGKYPHIIRKNRNSVAILTGKESEQQLKDLGTDVYSYFGLGCRNVSKLFVPQDFDFVRLLDNWQSFDIIADHHKYKNNFDYQFSLLLLNRVKHYASKSVLVRENEALASAISVVHYQYYTDENHLNDLIIDQRTGIQCVVGDPANRKDVIPFGQAQSPQLHDYADQVDTMDFLLNL